jgi:hypothetical protein
MLVLRSSLLAAAIVAALGASVSVAAAQKRFDTAEAAVDALVAAARANDRKTVLAILGPNSQELVSSGDPVEDTNVKKEFLAAYDTNHRIVAESGKPATLVIGPDDWPFPIPIVQKDGKWTFDVAAGREEILARRIGRNELAAIQTSLAYYDAQNDYADQNKDGMGLPVYAQRIISSPGKKDGLYWPAAQGEPDSPLGEAVAAATQQGYKVGAGPTPFHGYYYKVLTRQGPSAPGGAVDYVVRGDMIGGFALLAYPAEYGNSGIASFLVNNNGEVFEKDLGPDTAKIAASMTAFNPDHTWKKAGAAADAQQR